jgi:hypothetical protein
MTDKDELVPEELKRISDLLKGIKTRHKISIKAIVGYLDLDPKKYSSINDCAKKKHYPVFLIPMADVVEEKLKQLMENPALINTSKESIVENEKDGYENSDSTYVCLPLDSKKSRRPYTMGEDPGSVVEMTKGKWGLVVFRDRSAEGWLKIEDVINVTDIPAGTKLFLRRINKKDWQPDCYHLIIDASHQVSVRELLLGKKEGIVEYIPINSPEGRRKELPLSEIKAILTIEWAKFKPKPPRRKSTQ